MKENTNSSIPINNEQNTYNTILESTKALSKNNPQIPQNNISPNTTTMKTVQNPPSEQNTGFFGGIWKKIKSWWEIEEEEYIDAHGFKAKRPKTKIPLRNPKANLDNDAQFEGGEGLTYASQHSPFGRMFL